MHRRGGTHGGRPRDRDGERVDGGAMITKILKTQIQLIASEGHVLRCGDVTGHKVCIPLDGDPSEWTEDAETNDFI